MARSSYPRRRDGRGRRRPSHGRGGRPAHGAGRRSSRRTADASVLRFAVPLGILAVLAVVAYACMPRVDTRPLLFIGVDRTPSFEQVAGDDLQEQLVQLLGACAAVGCHVAADGLTGHSAGDSRVPVEATLELPGGGSDGVDADAVERQLATATATDIMSALPFDEDIACSDVISGFEVALNAMSSFEGDGPRSIVMFTDGWSNCAPWDLAAASRTPDGPAALLDELRAQGQIPDLEGVTVRIVGGGRSTVPDTQRTNRIQTFWQQYLEAAGATLPSDWWRTSLGQDLSLVGSGS